MDWEQIGSTDGVYSAVDLVLTVVVDDTGNEVEDIAEVTVTAASPEVGPPLAASDVQRKIQDHLHPRPR